MNANRMYGIGIDTGGTYTDAVLLDLRDHQVISTSKRPTIHHCLERSIVQALDDILPEGKAEAVRKIAFSRHWPPMPLPRAARAGSA
jgi:N-methylhydantoinase A/oxoprolinase/acetone carboxylase beta subunit